MSARSYRWLAITGLAALMVGPARPVHAFLGLDRIFRKKEVVHPHQQRAPKPGQKVRVFHLNQANADDIVPPLTGYLEGIHSDGSLFSDPKANTLIVTDSDEIMSRVETIVREMDKPYNNPNAQARQMLATQQMMRAIRALGEPAVASARTPSAPASAAGRAAPAAATSPVGVPAPEAASAPTRSVYADEASEQAAYRQIVEERPPLLGFQMVGWVRDQSGLLIMLSNSGQRYVFKRGQVLYGGVYGHDAVKGVHGAIQGDWLVLRDLTNAKLSLSMRPRSEREGGLR